LRWFSNLPDKIEKRQFTREEQVVLASQFRASVILEAADEVIYKIGRRASTQDIDIDIDSDTPSLTSIRNSMDSHESRRQPPEPTGPSVLPSSFYDTFRWLDDEEDLDLRLFLDDYHANLRSALPLSAKERRPSFRRHLSITKIPFRRPSLSSGWPANRDGSISSPSPAQGAVSPAPSTHHTRGKSRNLSFSSPRDGAQESSIASIDAAAAHYQDPEARLKLREYLASPQKFDEAVAIGFPSTDLFSATPEVAGDGRPAKKRLSRQVPPDEPPPHLHTFLNDNDDDEEEEEEEEAEAEADEDEEDEDEGHDNKTSLNSDQPSVADPDSPKTPQNFETPVLRPGRPSTDRTHVSRPSEGGSAQAPSSLREMTLRMTLTRPDLRAQGEPIYGWQKARHQPRQASQTAIHPFVHAGERAPKESMDRALTSSHRREAVDTAELGVIKRFWNRVRRA
jgi:hypothetical protein